jgi:hypothetical protein
MKFEIEIRDQDSEIVNIGIKIEIEDGYLDPG